MAIVQTGSKLDFPIAAGGATGTVSATITVPGDAEFVVVGLSSAINGVTDGHTAMTFTKGGVDAPMVRIGGADIASYWQTPVFYQALPDTGANKSLKWNWAFASSRPQAFSVLFFKGVDTASPVRATGVNTTPGAGAPLNTPTMTALTDDMIVAFAGFFHGAADGGGAITAWNNLTALGEISFTDVCEGAWATTTDITTPAVYSPLPPTLFASDVPNHSHRMRCPTTSGGTQVRVTFKSTTAGGWNALHCSVGIAAANTNTVATPVELKFGGASGFSIPPDTSITSDWTDLTFTAGQALVVVMDSGASPAFFFYWAGSVSAPLPPGTAHSWGPAAQTWNSSSDAGFTQVADTAVGVISVESNGAGSLSVGVGYCTDTYLNIVALVLKPAASGGGGGGGGGGMGLAVVTVAAGGLPVIDVTATTPGLGVPVTEAANGLGIPVTKVTLPKGGMPVTYVAAPLLAREGR